MAAPKLPHFRQPPSLRGRAKSRRESSLLQPQRGRGLWGGALAEGRGGGWHSNV